MRNVPKYLILSIALAFFAVTIITIGSRLDGWRTSLKAEQRDSLLAQLAVPIAGTRNLYVSPSGDDNASGVTEKEAWRTIQKAVDQAESGTNIHLAAGTYDQDIKTKKDGSSERPIRISGPPEAVVRGGGNTRIITVEHDHIVLEGFTVDGLSGDPNTSASYRDKLIYAVGTKPKDGVEGLRVIRMTLRNAGGECVRLRYFSRMNEIAYNRIENCGVYNFRFDGDSKNGEAIYIGTATEQLDDKKSPTADTDESNDNWIHDNSIDTQGNECVDIKEGSSGNLVENNTCTGQKDKESAGMNSMGDRNIFRKNEIYGNAGAGIRLGGDRPEDGIGNSAYGNTIRNNQEGGIQIVKAPQERICDNRFQDNGRGDFTGKFGGEYKKDEGCR